MIEYPAGTQSWVDLSSPVAAVNERVEAAGGGTVMDALQVMDAGTMAVFTDAEGAAGRLRASIRRRTGL